MLPAVCSVNARHFGRSLRYWSEQPLLSPAQRTMLRMLHWCFVREVDQGNIYGTGDLRTYTSLAVFLHNAWVMISATQGSRELEALRLDYERYTSFVFPEPILPDCHGRQRGHPAIRDECKRQYVRLMPLVLHHNTSPAACAALWKKLKRFDKKPYYKGKKEKRRPTTRH